MARRASSRYAYHPQKRGHQRQQSLDIKIVSDKAAHKVAAKSANADRRQPVVTIGEDLEIIEAYASAKEAARKTGLHSSVVTRRCNLECSSVFALNGMIYAWDDDNWLEKTLRRAMAELDALGIPYNNPYTSRYYDLPVDPDDGPDLTGLQWTEVLALAGT